MDASLQRSMSIRHCVPRWCTLSVYKNQVIWASRPNDAEPSIEATLRFAPHCLIIFVSPITRSMRAATRSSARPCSKGLSAFLASSACQPSTTSYYSCSAAPLPWPSAFSWAAPVFKSGRPLLAFGSNFAVKRTASPPLTLAVSRLNNIPANQRH